MFPEEVELICIGVEYLKHYNIAMYISVIAFNASGQVLCQSKVFCFCRYMGVEKY